MTLTLYLAHPTDSDTKLNEWAIDFSNRTGINVINPFKVNKFENLIVLPENKDEYYQLIDYKNIVKEDLRILYNDIDAVVAFVDGNISYGTPMEMICAKLKKIPVYSIISNGHENHPWLKYCSEKTFTNKDDFEKWISMDCHYCNDKMHLVGRNLEQKFKMFECRSCGKSWMEDEDERSNCS
jgi:hypothetical protein